MNAHDSTDIPHLGSCRIAIVGAGAAGLATAIFARRRDPTRSVYVLDGARAPGAKILVSGGGRCNVTNAAVTDRDFWGGRATLVRRVLRAFPVPQTVRFFDEIGVPLHEEAGGKLFPDGQQARGVLDALLRELRRTGGRLLAGHRVHHVRPRDGRFLVHTSRGDLHADAVVLATGGQALPKSGSDGAGVEMAARLGHTIVPTTPGLVPLELSDHDSLHRALSGVSQDVELTLRVDSAVTIRLTGALLWTHVGISGPVALNMSRHWLRAALQGRRTELTANVYPGCSFDDVDRRWTEVAAKRPRATLRGALAQDVPVAFGDVLLGAIGLDGAATLAHLSRDARRRLAHALTALPLPVTASRGYTHAEVTAGGVALDEIDPTTMASRLVPGLYLVGEVLDVDGRIGGFNFQWAWSSGYVAGEALGRA